MYSYNKLRAKIVEKYGSLKAFHEECEEELGIHYVTMSNKMRGKLGFSQEDIDTWRRLLDISLDEIGQYFFT